MRARGVCAAARIAFVVMVSRAFDRPGGCFSPFVHTTRYAIGLGPVFSLGRSAPPVHAILSNSATAAAGPRCTGVSPSVPTRSRVLRRVPHAPQLWIRDRLSAFRSPLLGGSRLISPPGLIDMLKFSPCSRAAQDVACGCVSSDARRELHRRCAARGLAARDVRGSSVVVHAGAYRFGLRSSSTPEPRDPPSRHVCVYVRVSPLQCRVRCNDPATGSPTAALLRLLLPPDNAVRGTFSWSEQLTRSSESVGATGGVYKGQGHSQRAFIAGAYWTFLVRGGQLQAPVPTTPAAGGWPRASTRLRAAAGIVVRVQPRVSKGITDLLARPRSSDSTPALAKVVGRSSRSLTR